MAARLLPLSRQHREELGRLMGQPPDPSRVPEEFWERVRRDEEETLALILILIFLAAASHQGTEPDDAGAAAQAAAYAARTAAQRAAEYAARSREMAIDLGDAARAAAASGTPMSEADIGGRLDSIFGEGRVRRIAVTETTAAISAGNEAGASANGGLSVADVWHTEEDGRVCEICRPLNNQRRDVWGAAFPSGPPAHPMCRCWIEYRSKFRNQPLPAPAGGFGPTTTIVDLT